MSVVYVCVCGSVFVDVDCGWMRVCVYGYECVCACVWCVCECVVSMWIVGGCVCVVCMWMWIAVVCV